MKLIARDDCFGCAVLIARIVFDVVELRAKGFGWTELAARTLLFTTMDAGDTLELCSRDLRTTGSVGVLVEVEVSGFLFVSAEPLVGFLAALLSSLCPMLPIRGSLIVGRFNVSSTEDESPSEEDCCKGGLRATADCALREGSNIDKAGVDGALSSTNKLSCVCVSSGGSSSLLSSSKMALRSRRSSLRRSRSRFTCLRALFACAFACASS